MIEVPGTMDGTGPRVEGCRPCQLFWFDRNEFDRLPSKPAPEEAAPPLPEAARRELALFEVRRLAREATTNAVSIAQLSSALFRLLGR